MHVGINDMLSSGMPFDGPPARHVDLMAMDGHQECPCQILRSILDGFFKHHKKHPSAHPPKKKKNSKQAKTLSFSNNSSFETGKERNRCKEGETQ